MEEEDVAKQTSYTPYVVVVLILSGILLYWQFSTNSGFCFSPSIKGNISSEGERIYHMTGQRFYDQTIIDKDKGEKMFCSEESAIDTGWRKSER
jgi:hypothetical protein